MVKLLHIGLTVPEQKWLSKELKNRTDYREINPFSNSDDEIKKVYDHHKPDIVFMQLQQEGAIGLGLLQYMSASSSVINWSGDVRDPLPEWYKEFDKYCISCFSNMRDVEEINGTYLQIGIDPEIFYPEKREKIYDIVFMANRSMCFPLSNYRVEIIDFLKKEYGSRFYLFGGWPGANGNLMNDQHAEAETYRKTKIALSISHFNIDRYFSDRLIRAMGSGGMVISHDYSGIEKDFEVGKHLDTFKDLDELKYKIDFYLANDIKREQIAKNGAIKVHNCFTTKNMVDDILSIYESQL